MATTAFTMEELQKTVEEQKGQMEVYERKLKDVVRAYKSLESEKKALEIALSAISPPESDPSSTANPGGSMDPARESAEPSDQLEALKKALATLTVENKRKEMAFQADRKALLRNNEDLKNQLGAKQGGGSSQQAMRKLRDQLNEAQANNERVITEHGQVLAEIQQHYAKEKQHSERMEQQVTELSKRLNEKDEQIKRAQQKLREVARMEQEIQLLRKKAECTPTVQVMKEELVNAKSSYDQELLTIRNRHALQLSALGSQETRIAQLEGRVNELTESGAAAEREAIELRQKLEKAEEIVKAKEAENRRVLEELAKKRKEKKAEEKDTVAERIAQLRLLYRGIINEQPGFDAYESLSLSKPAPKTELSPTSEATEDNKYKEKVNIVERRPTSSSTVSSAAKTKCPAGNSANCESCKELDFFKSLISHLQKKLTALEENHETTKRQHEQVSEILRQRIAELETSQERSYSQLQMESKLKVAEFEEELQKQRQRMFEIMAEKDREIEITKTSLATLYSRNIGGLVDPADPTPFSPPGQLPGSPTRRPMTPVRRLTANSTESINRRASVEDLADFSVSYPRRMSRSISQYGEAKNIFYEQELTRREQEIGELRNVIRLLELKVRDIEQAMLMKDIQYLQIIEALKEEIRVLEGRLMLEHSQTNMAYLRNIFVQFINSGSASGRKHILRAIGTVLQLTVTEMKRIDSWAH